MRVVASPALWLIAPSVYGIDTAASRHTEAKQFIEVEKYKEALDVLVPLAHQGE